MAFANDDQKLTDKYKIKPEEVTYCWWIIFDGLTRRYVQENSVDTANFMKTMSTKVFEPAYNFRGIQAQNFNDIFVIALILLIFYVLYTLWYGFSIMYIFEGLGNYPYRTSTDECGPASLDARHKESRVVSPAECIIYQYSTA
jgi:hypothetical protein